MGSEDQDRPSTGSLSGLTPGSEGSATLEQAASSALSAASEACSPGAATDACSRALACVAWLARGLALRGHDVVRPLSVLLANMAAPGQSDTASAAASSSTTDGTCSGSSKAAAARQGAGAFTGDARPEPRPQRSAHVEISQAAALAYASVASSSPQASVCELSKAYHANVWPASLPITCHHALPIVCGPLLDADVRMSCIRRRTSRHDVPMYHGAISEAFGYGTLRVCLQSSFNGLTCDRQQPTDLCLPQNLAYMAFSRHFVVCR